MTGHRDDAGLGAVARVRAVREQDDRIGLRLALAEAATRHERTEELLGMLARSPVTGTLPPRELLGQRAALGRLGAAVSDAEASARTADAVTAEARTRWEAARTRLAAVERLLEARAARRRADAERRTAKEADDLAAQRWLRATARTARPEERTR
ncbi:flagellar FliJ family protein [Nocardioides sp. TF02-7]|uniref:flagellar FliJ family protein n=1 Tax=Nocardioides sp. TF02-7 TaxID=2917724 RepID=UPI001F068A1A|nr:flagellar FliJ family protein [Nocardioides sp. TF02-7]UMG92961.1 flagellar FliJ family protein [Nocardioides sp. TF02-7]